MMVDDDDVEPGIAQRLCRAAGRHQFDARGGVAAIVTEAMAVSEGGDRTGFGSNKVSPGLSTIAKRSIKYSSPVGVDRERAAKGIFRKPESAIITNVLLGLRLASSDRPSASLAWKIH